MTPAALLDIHLPSPPLGPSPGATADALRSAGIRACSLDLGDREIRSDSGPPSTVGEALEAVVRADPRYRWETTPEGLLNLYPSPSVLDDEVPPRAVAGKGLWTALEEDLELERHGMELFMEFRDGDGPPVTADLKGGTLRAALNELVGPVAGTVWNISGSPGAFYLSITALA